MKADNFAPTPEMSTYLVAYIISKFKVQRGTTSNGLQVYI